MPTLSAQKGMKNFTFSKNYTMLKVNNTGNYKALKESRGFSEGFKAVY